MNPVSQPGGPPASLWRRIIIGRNPRVTLVRAAILALVSVVVFGFCLKPVRVKGISMSPSYRDGSIHFLNILAYRFGEPRRGDVVCVKTTGLHNVFMKRVVGLPGERVAIIRGQVFIDGEPLAEPYVTERAHWNWPEERLEPDEYFLIGDNRGMTQDLHLWGSVERERIVGKVIR